MTEASPEWNSTQPGAENATPYPTDASMPEMPIRFELAFKDTPQHIGLFTGLTNLNIQKQTRIKLLHLFDDLPIPKLGYKNVEYWFTTTGLQKFLPSIIEIRNITRRHGWSIVYKIIELDDDTQQSIAYQDKFQAAISQSINAPLEKFNLKKLKKLI